MATKRVSTLSLGLRIGFGLVLGLLALTIYATYRIQESFSERSLEIQRNFFHQQERLANLRRIIWLGSIGARDLFLNPAADRNQTYLDRLHDLRLEWIKDLEELANLGAPGGPIGQLRAQANDLWAVLERIPSSSLDEDARFTFLMNEISPRRREATAAVKRVEEATRSALNQSEAEVAATRRTSAQRLLALLGIDALLGLGVALYSIRNSEQLEARTNAQLREVSRARDELERLSARLMDIQEQERTRLARELHDEIVQNLAVLKIEITQARTLGARLPELAERLERARQIADRTMKTLRHTMLLLRPSLLDDLGLGPALQWLVEDFQQRTNVICRYSDDGLEEDLPDAVKTTVFRVLQEALHNAEKHAGARRVDVGIVRLDQSLAAEVRDDGIGFQLQPSSHGPQALRFGLMGMRERAVALGGSLVIKSAPGSGTAIILRIPLPERVEPAVGYVEKQA